MSEPDIKVGRYGTTLTLPGGVVISHHPSDDPYGYQIRRGGELVLRWGARAFALRLLHEEVGYPADEAERYLAAVDRGELP
ncbi:hypothetical protein J0910_15780 [Nocardiopsis sp. CNT-189]|uniref:hypothetical protein n=1 Tax=Nocardiopsis oceanisediminis TaxID=2816862 RepID=UPI003B34B6EB